MKTPRKKIALHWQIIVALILAVTFALIFSITKTDNTPFALGAIAICTFIGQLFMNALKMIVIPIIVSSVVCGMFSMGNTKGLGRLSGKTIAYYICTSLIAIVIGLTLVNLIQPGDVSKETAEAILGQATAPEAFLEKVEGKSGADLFGIFLRMVPPNILDVMSQNNRLLGVIVASILIGFFFNKLPKDLRDVHHKFWQGIQQAMIMVTDLILKFAPIGVFGLVLPIFMRTGLQLIMPLAMFFLTVILGLGIHFFISMGLILKYVGKISPIKHFKAMNRAIVTAFSTASSAATLPVTLETLEKDIGVSNRVSSFVLPLGATVNMDGTALYECVVVLFIAQFYAATGAFEITLGMQITVVTLALLTSIGVAGIPAASLVAITLILSTVGLPLEGIGLVIAIDRILDMCRTSVNVFGDSVGTVIIAKSEGERVY